MFAGRLLELFETKSQINFSKSVLYNHVSNHFNNFKLLIRNDSYSLYYGCKACFLAVE